MHDRVCPRCRAALTTDDDGALRCAACAAVFPSIGGVSVLTVEPRFLAQTYAELWRAWRALQGIAADVEVEIERGARRPALRAFAAGTRTNEAFLRSHLDVLKPHVDADDLLAADPGADIYTHGDALLRYAARDWGDLPEHRAEVQAVAGPLFDAIDALPHGRGRVLVLGSGAGRYAWDLRSRFAEVDAVDLSWPMAATFQRVRREPVQLAEATLQNMRDDSAVCRAVPLRIEHAVTVTEPGDVRVTVAHAEALPFADGSFDVCVAAFFTDALPVSRLLREVGRVTAPDGLFVSLGALNWPFKAPRAAKLSRAELLQELNARGFAIEREGVHTIDLLSGPGLAHLVYDATLIAARWTGAGDAAGLASSSHLFVEEGTAFLAAPQTLKERMRGETARVTAQLLDGREVQIDASLTELLALVGDGASLAELHARARAKGIDVEVTDVVEACRPLVDAGVLRVRR